MIDIEVGRVLPRIVVVVFVGALILVLLRHEINKAQQQKDGQEGTSPLRKLRTNLGNLLFGTNTSSDHNGHPHKRSVTANETTKSDADSAAQTIPVCSADWYLFFLFALAAAAILLACGGLLYGSNCRRHRPADDEFSPDKWWMSGDEDMMWNLTSLAHHRSKQLNKSEGPARSETGRSNNGEATPLMSTSAYRGVVKREVEPLQSVDCNLNLFQDLPVICAPTNIRKTSKSVT